MTVEQYYFLVSQRLMPPHLTLVDCKFIDTLLIGLCISWAGSCVPMLYSTVGPLNFEDCSILAFTKKYHLRV